MAIYVPGRRNHRTNRPLGGGKRAVVAMLSMTALVDMFTVLAVFLLQNYQTTGEVIEISDKVILPQASAVKEIKPATVVTISKFNIQVNKENVATFQTVKEQEDWMIQPLQQKLQDAFKALDDKRRVVGLVAIKKAVDDAKDKDPKKEKEDDTRVTVQADKSIDFLTLKKVMYTVTEAGASQINFAVLKSEDKKAN
jgi:biopolymer transport protein ExbD